MALSEMTRLYCFDECEVIVLPRVEDAADFPGDTKNAWGAVNSREYKLRGWAFTEFSTARIAGRIVNETHPDVVELLGEQRDLSTSGQWPHNLIEYSETMEKKTDELDENGQKQHWIRFTSKGDNEKVKYIFFRMAYTLTGRRAYVASEVAELADAAATAAAGLAHQAQVNLISTTAQQPAGRPMGTARVTPMACEDVEDAE